MAGADTVVGGPPTAQHLDAKSNKATALEALKTSMTRLTAMLRGMSAPAFAEPAASGSPMLQTDTLVALIQTGTLDVACPVHAALLRETVRISSELVATKHALPVYPASHEALGEHLNYISLLVWIVKSHRVLPLETVAFACAALASLCGQSEIMRGWLYDLRVVDPLADLLALLSGRFQAYSCPECGGPRHEALPIDNPDCAGLRSALDLVLAIIRRTPASHTFHPLVDAAVALVASRAILMGTRTNHLVAEAGFRLAAIMSSNLTTDKDAKPSFERLAVCFRLPI